MQDACKEKSDSNGDEAVENDQLKGVDEGRSQHRVSNDVGVVGYADEFHGRDSVALKKGQHNGVDEGGENEDGIEGNGGEDVEITD